MTEPDADVEALARTLAAEPDRRRALGRLLSHARGLTGAEAGTVYVREGSRLRLAAAQNDVLARRLGPEAAERALTAEPLMLGQRGIASYVALTRATVNEPDVYEIAPEHPYVFDRRVDDAHGYRTRSMLTLPLRDAHGRLWGVLQLINAVDAGGAVVPFDAGRERLTARLAAAATPLAPPPDAP